MFSTIFINGNISNKILFHNLTSLFFRGGTIAPHDIIYYHLIASARKILFSLFQAGTCRPPSAISAATVHPSAYDFRTRAASRPATGHPAPRPERSGPTAAPISRTASALRAPVTHSHHLPRPGPRGAAALLAYVVRKSGRARAGVDIY